MGTVQQLGGKKLVLTIFVSTIFVSTIFVSTIFVSTTFVSTIVSTAPSARVFCAFLRPACFLWCFTGLIGSTVDGKFATD